MRDNSDLTGMGKNSLPSQYRAAKESLTGPMYTDGDLVTENRAAWFNKNVGSVFKKRCKIPIADPDYDGIFDISKDDEEAAVTIALLSDWATDTAEARLVARQAGKQDYSIHLGDTYYIGNLPEIKASFFPENKGTWPYGNLGSFAMLGNHEMYSGGSAYFNQLLSKMGTFNADGTLKKRQQLSYFCLQNKYWRIIALDTGYDSLKLKVIPNSNLDLSDEQKYWFENQVMINNDKRGIIILSHHQCYSAFEGEFKKPMEYLSDLMKPFPRNIIWLWGHEHWFSVYGRNQMDNGGNIFARCIGNSGMPVELDVDGGVKRPKNVDPGPPENRNLVLYDQRERLPRVDGNIRVGHNGYVIMTLTGPSLSLQYFDDNNLAEQGRLILEENWTCDINSGWITGVNIKDHTVTDTKDLFQQLSLFGNDLNDAIT